jgi:hypothetical protein
MNKFEIIQLGVCLLCGELMENLEKSTKDVTNFTKTSIEEILGKYKIFIQN